MKKEQFLEILCAQLSISELEFLMPILEVLEEKYWSDLLFCLNGKYKNADGILKGIKEVLLEEAKDRARKSRIKGFEGGRVKEVEILTRYFYLKSCQSYKIKG